MRLLKVLCLAIAMAAYVVVGDNFDNNINKMFVDANDANNRRRADLGENLDEKPLTSRVENRRLMMGKKKRSMMKKKKKRSMMKKKSSAMSKKDYKKPYPKEHFPAPPEFFVSNACVTTGSCIQSARVAPYPMNAACDWTLSAAGTLKVIVFDLEEGFDFLGVDGVLYTGTGAGLDGLPVEEGTVITFRSDDSDGVSGAGNTGFRICVK